MRWAHEGYADLARRARLDGQLRGPHADGEEVDMMTAPASLVVDLLRWVLARPRTYRETMDAWRTSCPRLSVWEDALDSGFVRVTSDDCRNELIVSLTPAGLAFLEPRY
jgi:hypothetical protein